MRSGGGACARNVARLADPPRAAKSRATAWSSQRVRAGFLGHVADDRLYALWRLAATTGMRRGELAGASRGAALDLGRDAARRLSGSSSRLAAACTLRPAEVGPFAAHDRPRRRDGRRATSPP